MEKGANLMIQDFLFPKTVDEALEILTQNSGKARIFAGGTALQLDGNKLSDHPAYYVSLSKVNDLDGVSEQNGSVVIGANSTLGQCAKNDLIQKHASALAQACGNLGSAQIRNMATVTGNIVGAKPFADAAVVLTALGATCVIQSAKGTKELSLPEMYAKLGESAVNSSAEVVTKIKFPALKAGEGTAYERLEIRNGLSFPVVNVAVRVMTKNGVISEASIVAAPLNPGPLRITAVEEFLSGKAPGEEVFEKAGKLAADNVKFRNSPEQCRAQTDGTCMYDTCHYCLNPVSSSAEYRYKVLPVLISRSLLKATGMAV
jgi:CO/xanthine dehydrogenase FAD-binding subunit